jgi:hypothetical protein
MVRQGAENAKRRRNRPRRNPRKRGSDYESYAAIDGFDVLSTRRRKGSGVVFGQASYHVVTAGPKTTPDPVAPRPAHRVAPALSILTICRHPQIHAGAYGWA